MKYLLIPIFLSLNAQASIPRDLDHMRYVETVCTEWCDQKEYDELYKAIVQHYMGTKTTPQDFEKKHNQIETLRRLCRGQKSNYEKTCPKKYNR